MPAPTGSAFEDSKGSSGQVPSERKRPPLFFRLKIPAWLALVAVLVTVAVAFFLTGPARSTARDFDNNFSGTQQVEITYCLSNAQAVESGRERARAALEARLRELGVKDPKITFVSPCPTAGSATTTGGIGGGSQVPTAAPAAP
ncbi:MAG: hypothetical protein DCC49_00920 [Acidobacteria bacterium]|nr:MAG: hypothetical protein DCC49_00920 [Acidobacteriota bacterium]